MRTRSEIEIQNKDIVLRPTRLGRCIISMREMSLLNGNIASDWNSTTAIFSCIARTVGKCNFGLASLRQYFKWTWKPLVWAKLIHLSSEKRLKKLKGIRHVITITGFFQAVMAIMLTEHQTLSGILDLSMINLGKISTPQGNFRNQRYSNRPKVSELNHSNSKDIEIEG